MVCPQVRKQQEAEEAGSAPAAAPSSSGATSAASAPAAGSRSGASAAAGSGAASASGSSGGGAAPAAVDPRRVERAERFKGRGNELFKAGAAGGGRGGVCWGWSCGR